MLLSLGFFICILRVIVVQYSNSEKSRNVLLELLASLNDNLLRKKRI